VTTQDRFTIAIDRLERFGLAPATRTVDGCACLVGALMTDDEIETVYGRPTATCLSEYLIQQHPDLYRGLEQAVQGLGFESVTSAQHWSDNTSTRGAAIGRLIEGRDRLAAKAA